VRTDRAREHAISSQWGDAVSDVHYFPRYSQPENVITNNALLLLLRLYDHDRFKFGRFLHELLGDDLDLVDALGLQFQQQRGTGHSIVDGFVAQDSVRIVVETKRANANFVARQLQGHLAAFGTTDHKILMLLSPTAEHLTHPRFRPLMDTATKAGVSVFSVSFEGMINAARASLPDHDEAMLGLVEDFTAFCSEEGLLPRDEYMMFVPPCGKSYGDNIQFSLYYWPESRSWRRTAYLGVYRAKAIHKVGRIAKVVACSVDTERDTVTPVEADTTLTPEDKQRILGVTRAAAARRGWDLRRGHRFFLCDRLEDTHYNKASPGGMRGHRYFDLGNILGDIPKDVAELGRRLQSETWT